MRIGILTGLESRSKTLWSAVRIYLSGEMDGGDLLPPNSSITFSARVLHPLEAPFPILVHLVAAADKSNNRWMA
ncbi:hypothetical protein CEXT_669271 [Caerostris extrusa]|uniref:Uncharacterized protein n=1 Tax=Caerostris extrusa TaxID=172846 RepID=A0AAV4RQI6_CAEEX|nr:hypothetical protein CEXT_669271 [Caerostris extrusa]